MQESRVEGRESRAGGRFSGPSPSALRPRPSRRALTLIELLVVIIILSTLVAAAIPILAPADSDRALREATRGLNTFITGAHARAIELKRPYGIALKKLSADTERFDPTAPDNDNSVCVEVFYVEQLPPYTGFDENAAARVCIDPDTAAPPNQVLIQFVRRGNTSGDFLPVGWDFDLFPPGMIRRGDEVEIAGTRYTLMDTDPDGLDTNGFYLPSVGEPDGTLAALPVNNSGQMINSVDRDLNTTFPGRFWSPPISYKVLRQPTPTSSEPYQLPEGVAIDLRASGVGSDNYFYAPGVHDNSLAPMIMFTPEGRVERVSFSRYGTLPHDEEPFNEPVVDNVYLLVGRRENIPAPLPLDDLTLALTSVNAANTDEKRQELREPVNWLEDESRWVVIGAQSGRIVSTENSFVDLAGTIATYSTAPHPLGSIPFSESSEQMRNAQIYEAREFTREMSQLGGR